MYVNKRERERERMIEREDRVGGKRERERYPDFPGVPETRRSVCLIWGGVGLAPLVHNIQPFSPNIFISKRDTILNVPELCAYFSIGSEITSTLLGTKFKKYPRI